MPTLTDSHVRELLITSKNPELERSANDAGLVLALVRVFNVSLEILVDVSAGGARSTGQVAGMAASKMLSVSEVGAAATRSQNMELANFVGGQAVKSLGMAKAFSMTPGKAGVFLTIAMVDKVAAAAGLAQLAKCEVAVATMVASGAMGTMVCAGSFGIACLPAVIGFAADAFNAYGQCYPQRR